MQASLVPSRFRVLSTWPPFYTVGNLLAGGKRYFISKPPGIFNTYILEAEAEAKQHPIMPFPCPPIGSSRIDSHSLKLARCKVVEVCITNQTHQKHIQFFWNSVHFWPVISIWVNPWIERNLYRLPGNNMYLWKYNSHTSQYGVWILSSRSHHPRGPPAQSHWAPLARLVMCVFLKLAVSFLYH